MIVYKKIDCSGYATYYRIASPDHEAIPSPELQKYEHKMNHHDIRDSVLKSIFNHKKKEWCVL